MDHSRNEQLPLPKDFADGAKFMGYLIRERIGAGGFGRVFHCAKEVEDGKPPQPFAMKIITLRNQFLVAYLIVHEK